MGLFHFTMLALLVGVFAGPTTVLHFSRERARQGDEVTITCKVANFDPDADTLVKINKYVRITEVDEDSGKRKVYEETLSINTILEDPYIDAGRFSVTKVTTGSTGLEYVLRITNLQPEDTAAYVCQIAGTDAYDDKTFQVYTMPTNVHFMNFSNWDLNQDILHFEEGDVENVGCMAMGGVPQPRFEIVVGELNYTGKFKHHESEIALPECYADGVLDKCLLHYTTESEVEAMDFRPLYKADGKVLECRAHVDGSGMEPVTARLHIQMKYKPKFFCFQKHKVAIHTKKYELKCTVLTNPTIEEVKFEFEWNGKTETLMEGQSTTDNEIEFLQTVRPDGSKTETEVTLRFEEIFERHYTTSFKLWARNGLGQNSTILQLVDETYVRGSADTVVYSGILALFVCILSVFMS